MRLLKKKLSNLNAPNSDSRESIYEMMRESQLPINIHKIQRFNEKKFHENTILSTNIFSFVIDKEEEVKDLMNIGTVCKQWNQTSDIYWKSSIEKIKKQIPKEFDGSIKKNTNKETWIELNKINIKTNKKKKPEQKSISIKESYSIPMEEIYKIYEEKEKDENKKIIFNSKDKSLIDASSLNGLVEELTSYERYNPTFLQDFILTYRSYTTKEELFTLLKERFNYPPPKNSTEEEFVTFKKEILNKIRIRIIQAVRYWVENFYKFDFNDQASIEMLEGFIKMVDESNEESYSKLLRNTINNVIEGKSMTKNTKESDYPKIMVPKKSLFRKKFTNRMLEWPSMEFARQISLIEFEIFEKIEPKECLDLNFSRKNKEELAPNITTMIKWFNKLSNWIGTEIVNVADIDERARVVSKFIEIGTCLIELNNFNGLFEITSGLGLAPIFRLKKTFLKVENESIEKLKEFGVLTNNLNNFDFLRKTISKVSPPCIPYLGIYLTDLTFAQENQKYIGELVNFEKCRIYSEIIKRIQIYQNQSYKYLINDELHDYLKNDISFLNEKEMYSLSCLREEKLQKIKK
jgi:son of sevenless